MENSFYCNVFCFLLGPLILLILPNIDEEKKNSNSKKSFIENFLNWIKSAVIEPFTEFIKNRSGFGYF